MDANCTAGERYVPWSFPLCATMMAMVVLGSVLGLVKFSEPWRWHFPRRKIWSSRLLFISPVVLLSFRFIAFAYNLGVQIASFIAFGFGQTVYFTIWNYCLLILFFGLGVVLTALGLFSSSTESRRDPRFLEKTYVILFQICFTLSIIVDVVLWGVLYPGALKAKEENPDSTDLNQILNFYSYNQHGANFAWILAEFLLNDVPFSLAHVGYILLWACSFGAFSWIYHQFSCWWAYPFLETTVPEAPLWYGGLMLVHVMVYLILFGLYHIKIRLCTRQQNRDSFVDEESLNDDFGEHHDDLSDSVFDSDD